MSGHAMKESRHFRRGITLFNAAKFFEAHEVWEELWLKETGPEKMFLQGLIQLAAAFHHHVRGNSRGRHSLLAAGLEKLGQFPDEHRGIAVEKLRSDALAWVQSLGQEQGDRSARPPRVKLARRSSRKTKRGG
jgi:predicted metal-dependent hydrolase